MFQVRILDDDELGAGNTVQVVAYKSGSVFAGGVLLLVRDSYGWGAMFNAFAGMYVIAVILLSKISIVERADEGKKSGSNDMRYWNLPICLCLSSVYEDITN